MTPEEHEIAKRLFWEKTLLAMLPDPRMTVKHAAELADEAVKEWKQRFEKRLGRGK
ncbi:MAG TPA: hypothetical protein VNM37_27225 [Candidatus Dormibacteraeota bacterium]|nr:hypothetical protein [Candidatus Dormibacteraeota bacterium]